MKVRKVKCKDCNKYFEHWYNNLIEKLYCENCLRIREKNRKKKGIK